MDVVAIVQNIWPSVMEIIKWTIPLGRWPCAIVHLLNSITSGQILHTPPLIMVTSRRKTIKALFLCYFYPALIVYIYIYVWKLNQTVLELDLWAVKFCSSLNGIWTHTIDTLQHQSLSLMSSALDHSTISAIKI
jgi:hypothetical protein